MIFPVYIIFGLFFGVVNGFLPSVFKPFFNLRFLKNEFFTSFDIRYLSPVNQTVNTWNSQIEFLCYFLNV